MPRSTGRFQCYNKVMTENERLHESWERVLSQQEKRFPRPEAKESEVKEALRQEVGRMTGGAAAKASSPSGAAPPLPHKLEPSAQELEHMPDDRQVKFLVMMAMQDGVDKAVDLARRVNSAFVLDELHDLIVDQLFNELVKRGKLAPR